MEDFPAKLADLLESIALKVRALTIDRVQRVIKVMSLGLITLFLGILALILLALAAFFAVAAPLGTTAAFAIFGGVFLVAGALIWGRRNRPPKEDHG